MVREGVFASSLAGPALINALRVELDYGNPLVVAVDHSADVIGPLEQSALMEMGNIVCAAYVGVLGTFLHRSVMIGTPAVTLPSVVPGIPTSIPEIALVKKSDQRGVANRVGRAEHHLVAFSQRRGDCGRGRARSRRQVRDFPGALLG